MPLFPVKDRTIRLTLETRDDDGHPQVTNATQPRYGAQFIPNSGLLGGLAAKVGLVGVNKTLDLVGPTSISIDHEAAVASEPGLFTTHMQPWFIKPVKIQLAGTSYIGAYNGIPRSDRDAKGILEKFRSSQNDFISIGGRPGDMRRVLLELTGMPRGFSRFLGYMTDFGIKEVVDKAYLLQYTMGFIGRNVDDASIRKGNDGGKDALARQGGVS